MTPAPSGNFRRLTMTPAPSGNFRWLPFSLLLALVIFLSCGTALAEAIGKLTRIEGAVDIMPGGQLPAVPARDGAPVQKGDFVRTKSNARAEITFSDGSVIKIAPRSRIDLSEYSNAGRRLGLPRGKVQATVVPAAAGKAPYSFEIRTPNAIAGVRGTSFYVYHQGNITGVAVTHGVVYTASLTQPTRGVTLIAGTGTTVAGRHPPTPPRPISDRELNGHRNDVTPVAPPGAATGNAGAASGETGSRSSAASSSASPAANSAASTAGSTAASTAPGATAASGSAESTAAASNAASSATPGSASADSGTASVTTAGAASALDTTLQSATSLTATQPATQVITPTLPPTPPPVAAPAPAPIPDPTPIPAPAAPLFQSTLGGALMSRGASIDPNSNLLTIVNDPWLTLTLSGTASLWTGSAQATLSGLYPAAPLQQPDHYWFGELFSNSTANHTTADHGAYFGYFGGSSLDGTGATNTILNALYIDPTGKAGIMQGTLPGSITAGALNGAGAISLTEMDPAIGIDSASLPVKWWDSKTGSAVVEVTGNVLTDSSAVGAASGTSAKQGGSEGYLLDPSLNIASRMNNRGDVLRLGYLAAAPSFGIWSRESFGSYNGNASRFALISNAKWGTQNADGSFNADNEVRIITLGNWQPGGSLSGTADGVWGELGTGSVKLLTGALTGSSNLGASTFGAVSTGSFIDLSRFLAAPGLAAQLGFPTLKGPESFTLAGKGASGSVSLGNLSFYSRSAGDPVSLWIAPNLSGSYGGGLQGQNFLLVNAGAGSGSIVGTMQVTGVTPASATGTWLGSIDAIGETGSSFRSEFDGVAAGSFNGTTFTGSAAGLSHPVTYYSAIKGGAITRFSNGAAVSYGSIDGVMGGMSLWGSTPGVTSGFKGVGFFTPNQAAGTGSDFVLSAALQSKDLPSGTALTADGGAYQGHLVAGITGVGSATGTGTGTGTGTPGAPAMVGVMNALSIDPSGNAGVLHGDFSGYVDPVTKVWTMDGDLFPVTLATLAAGAAANLNSGGVSTVTTRFYAAPPNAGGTFFSGTPAPTAWAPGSITRSYLNSSPDWGIGEFGLYAGYSGAPPSLTLWNIDFTITDAFPATLSLVGTMAGKSWDPETGKLSAETRASWLDTQSAQPAATPMTGIFIGETVGSFNPVSLQALTSGIWLETRKFLGLAATTAGQATLQKLNIPAVEVGKADFTGGNANFDVTIKDLRFFAPVGGGRPQLFATDTINGNYFVPSPSGSATLSQVPGAGGAVSGIAPTFSMNQWDASNNKWSATLAYKGAGGVVAGNSNILFIGTAAGRSSGGGASGTFTGTAAGVVK